MLARFDVMAFVPVSNFEEAKAFYSDVLGLEIVDETPFAIALDANGTSVRLTLVDDFEPQPFTILGWRVADIARSVIELADAGVSFERFEGMTQDMIGIWTAPDGAKVAWFRDPDGNLLSLTQFAG